MNCFYHEEEEFCGSCNICGRHLCRSCFDLTVGHICIDCVKINLETTKQQSVANIIKIFVGIIVSFIISYFIFWETDKLLFVVLGLSFIPNYLFLGDLANKIMGPRIYNGLGIIIAFVIKLLLAYFLSAFFVGIIISIYYIIKNIYYVVKWSNNFDNVVNSFYSIGRK